MIGLQEKFEQHIQDAANPELILKASLKKKFQKLHISLSEEQLDKIYIGIFKSHQTAITVNLDDCQVVLTGLTKTELKKKMQNIFDSLPDDALIYIDALIKAIPNIITETASDISPLISASLKNNTAQMLKNKRQEADSFESRLSDLWGNALDLSEAHIVTALEAGEYINNTQRTNAVNDNDFVFETLIRLHARACQISSEILSLLKRGFADGAHARWRSLHEVTVIGRFIAAHDNDLAERYILHKGIDSYKASLQYVEYTEALGVEPLTEVEINEIHDTRNKLIQRFGKNYSTDYGWASTVLNNNRPTFRDIESNVGLDHLRPYYKLASYNVHGNAKGVFYKLGLSERNCDLLLAGQSNLGLAESGHSMALSLNQITIAVLTKYPTLDNIIISRVLLDMASEIGDAYAKSHNELQE